MWFWRREQSCSSKLVLFKNMIRRGIVQVIGCTLMPDPMGLIRWCLSPNLHWDTTRSWPVNHFYGAQKYLFLQRQRKNYYSSTCIYPFGLKGASFKNITRGKIVQVYISKNLQILFYQPSLNPMHIGPLQWVTVSSSGMAKTTKSI